MREDVSGEMIQDLGSIRLENDEAVRYATTWVREGVISADRSRKITRMTGESESTPGRDGNYVAFDVMITSLALQLVRDDLVKSKDDHAMQIIDDLMIKLEIDDSARSVLERVLHDTQGPRSFMEQLYYRGITDGVTTNNGKSVNILKVAENLFDARVAIAKESAKLLSLQSLQNRQYYKMIKDYGGFQRLDMSNTPKMKFIDLDARALDEAKEDAVKLRLAAEAAAAELLVLAAESDQTILQAAEMEKELDSDTGYSNSSGPMMM